jgi:hypothetical protein
MRGKTRSMSGAFLFGVALALCLALAPSGSAQQAGAKTGNAEKPVYVCACKGTSSCPCMSMANMKGKCACGEHSPDMKAVSRDSAWAKTNRKALSD